MAQFVDEDEDAQYEKKRQKCGQNDNLRPLILTPEPHSGNSRRAQRSTSRTASRVVTGSGRMRIHGLFDDPRDRNEGDFLLEIGRYRDLVGRIQDNGRARTSL